MIYLISARIKPYDHTVEGWQAKCFRITANKNVNDKQTKNSSIEHVIVMKERRSLILPYPTEIKSNFNAKIFTNFFLKR
jgi:hypothetical protein